MQNNQKNNKITYMTLCIKKKILLLSLAACFLIPPIFAEPQVNNNFCSECEQNRNSKEHDTNCPDCLKIELSKNIKSPHRISDTAVYPVDSLTYSNKIILKYIDLNIYELSPVTLKVRSNS